MAEPVCVDARGLKCPLPVLKAEKALDRLDGDIAIEILTTDPIARIDIPLLAQKRGLTCTIEKFEDGLRFTLTESSQT